MSPERSLTVICRCRPHQQAGGIRCAAAVRDAGPGRSHRGGHQPTLASAAAPHLRGAVRAAGAAHQRGDTVRRPAGSVLQSVGGVPNRQCVEASDVKRTCMSSAVVIVRLRRPHSTLKAVSSGFSNRCAEHVGIGQGRLQTLCCRHPSSAPQPAVEAARLQPLCWHLEPTPQPAADDDDNLVTSFVPARSGATAGWAATALAAVTSSVAAPRAPPSATPLCGALPALFSTRFASSAILLSPVYNEMFKCQQRRRAARPPRAARASLF